MKTGAPQVKKLVPILFLIHAAELHNVVENLEFVFYCFTVDALVCFTFEEMTQAKNKLGIISNIINV